MKRYEEISIVITVIDQSDVVTSSPGGIEFGKDENNGDLGWGV